MKSRARRSARRFRFRTAIFGSCSIARAWRYANVLRLTGLRIQQGEERNACRTIQSIADREPISPSAKKLVANHAREIYRQTHTQVPRNGSDFVPING